MDNGLWTEKFSDEPITGKVFGYFGEVSNPKKVYLGNIRNGKREGKWVFWNNSTGRKEWEINYKDGKYDGLSTEWYENGKKKNEGTFKDGKPNGLVTRWFENGQKKLERTFKDGKPDGLYTDWYENGQKNKEITFKDGKRISKKWWNEDGSVKE